MAAQAAAGGGGDEISTSRNYIEALELIGTIPIGAPFQRQQITDRIRWLDIPREAHQRTVTHIVEKLLQAGRIERVDQGMYRVLRH